MCEVSFLQIGNKYRVIIITKVNFIYSDNINQIKDNLSIQIFDETIEDLIEDDRLRMTEIYQRISSKYLGEMRIPFSTIFSVQRVIINF